MRRGKKIRSMPTMKQNVKHVNEKDTQESQMTIFNSISQVKSTSQRLFYGSESF